MYITTSSGSIYEIDSDIQRVRRLTGEGPPTERVGEGWRTYVRLEVEAGLPMIVVWEYDGPIAKSTVTSNVTKIIEKGEMQ